MSIARQELFGIDAGDAIPHKTQAASLGLVREPQVVCEQLGVGAEDATAVWRTSS
jgi:hypothetical protein